MMGDGRWVWLEEVEYKTDVDDLDIGHLGSYSNFYRLKSEKTSTLVVEDESDLSEQSEDIMR